MTNGPEPQNGPVSPPTSMEDIDALLGLSGELLELEKRAIENDTIAKAAISAQTAAIVDPIRIKRAAIDEAIADYQLKHRKNILARFGRTIKLSNGVIKWRIVPRSVEVPKDTKPIVNFLKNRRNGRKVLRQIWALDKEALANADSRLLRQLNRNFTGFWAGKHEHVMIQPRGEDKARTVAQRRYRESTRQQKMN